MMTIVSKIKIGRVIIFATLSFPERLFLSSQILGVRLIVSERTESFVTFVMQRMNHGLFVEMRRDLSIYLFTPVILLLLLHESRRSLQILHLVDLQLHQYLLRCQLDLLCQI